MNILKLSMIIYKKNKILSRTNNYSKYNLKKIITKNLLKIRIILLIIVILIILKMRFRT